MRRSTQAAVCTAMAVLVTTSACRGLLDARNNDAPDLAGTLSTPDGITALDGSTYREIWTANNGSNVSIYTQLISLSLESYSALPGPRPRNVLPPVAISNFRGDALVGDFFNDFSRLSRNSRTAANVIIALDRLVANGLTLGSAGTNARARSFALFTSGVSLGNLALAFDSAAIVTQAVPSGQIPPLSGAAELMTAALANLDSAIALASAPSSLPGFPLPSGWINGNAMSAVEFVRFVRSYRARFRAGVTRTPAQRAAVDWAAVIADVENGIQADVNVALDPNLGWRNAWIDFHYGFGGVHQMTPMIIGMADTSGRYGEWISLPLASREPFLIRTPDRRFPSGETREAQIANSPSLPTGVQYFRNRNPGGDTPGEPWGMSFYDFYRWQTIFNARGIGSFPLITKAEMDMLAAEGHLRQGQIAPAAALIDRYRVRAGLLALTGVVTTSTMPVPGGRACVPRVPTSAGNTAECGTIFEAMKWEKRMETAFTGWASWYFDSRGWGDLPEGAALEFPVPFQELEVRKKPFYNLGGIGGRSAAPKGTYGW